MIFRCTECGAKGESRDQMVGGLPGCPHWHAVRGPIEEAQEAKEAKESARYTVVTGIIDGVYDDLEVAQKQALVAIKESFREALESGLGAGSHSLTLILDATTGGYIIPV